jgi:hypothetical protein
MPTRFAVANAKWEVLWVTTKGGKRIVAYDCGEDFVEARRIYLIARDAGKPFATLRSKNVAFPPPEQKLEKMMAFNRRGAFWCPYCMEMRRFEKLDGFHSESGAWVEVAQYYCCPMCGISLKHSLVASYNPLAMQLTMPKQKRLRKGKGGKRRRKR